jgi:cell division protein FtsA
MVTDLILQSLAAGRSTLTPEEKDLGVALIDLGGGTTDVLVYSEGTPYSTFTIPAGGVQVTSDISIIKNVSIETAEKIKIESGCCWEELLEEDEDIIVPGVGGRPPLPIPRSQILAIIRPRMEEIFKMVRERLEHVRLSRPLGGGVVLTGGGAMLAGAVELASHILKLPVRVGTPIRFPGLAGLVDEYRSPVYATAIGLALEGNDRAARVNAERSADPRQAEKRQFDVLGKIKRWISREFF